MRVLVRCNPADDVGSGRVCFISRKIAAVDEPTEKSLAEQRLNNVRRFKNRAEGGGAMVCVRVQRDKLRQLRHAKTGEQHELGIDNGVDEIRCLHVDVIFAILARVLTTRMRVARARNKNESDTNIGGVKRSGRHKELLE